jgi:4-amino-4-deoxy-L-arabinose transferase-like glycosyltransferase
MNLSAILAPWPKTIGHRDRAIALLFALVYIAFLLGTVRTLGFPRDEGFYFRASHDYVGFWLLLFREPKLALTQGAIDAHFSYNHEHPALMKSLAGLSWHFLHEQRKVFSDASTAFRFPAIVLSGLAVGTTYLFGARAISRPAGFVAATLLACMPRVFFHAHLHCFDVPIMAMWVFVLYAHYRATQTGSFGWALWAGVAYGLALGTKHNAWMLPAVLVPHALFAVRKPLTRQLALGRLVLPLDLVAMATIGPLVFLASWPWLWNDTQARLQEYVNFHLHHEYYNIEFLHRNYFGPPSPKSYLPVMVAATVPAVTLLLFVIGTGRALRDAGLRVGAWLFRLLRKPLPWRTPLPTVDRGEPDLLFVLAMGAAMGPFFLPATPIFGGTKHWLPAYPFLALLAGRGFDFVFTKTRALLSEVAIEERLRRALGSERAVSVALFATLFVAVAAAPFAVTAHSHPFGLSSYVPLVGGTAGGADLGLNRQYWGYTTQDANAYLEPNAPPNASVFIHDTAWDSWARMVAEKRVRPDLRAVFAPSEGQLSLVHHELHMNELDYQIWTSYGTASPVHVVTHDGVPVVSIYARP